MRQSFIKLKWFQCFVMDIQPLINKTTTNVCSEKIDLMKGRNLEGVTIGI